MGQDAAAVEKQAELLSWENLGAQPAGRAFRRSLAELLARPGEFFGKVATSGGLFEPLTFFAIVLGAALVMGFPAALAYLALAAPDPEQLGLEAYATVLLPARTTGLLLVLLPLALAVGCMLMVLLGTLFHAAAKAFGARNWEGSVSIWLYSASGALAPLVAATGVVLAVSLAGYLLSLLWPDVRGPARQFAGWTVLVLYGGGLLAGAVALLAYAATGCVRTFRMENVTGVAAGVSGVLCVGTVIGLSAWSFGRWSTGVGLCVVALWATMAGLAALVCASAGRRAAGGR